MVTCRWTSCLALLALWSMAHVRAGGPAFAEVTAAYVGGPDANGDVLYEVVRLQSLVSDSPQAVAQLSVSCPDAPDLADWRTTIVRGQILRLPFRVEKKAGSHAPWGDKPRELGRLELPPTGWTVTCVADGAAAPLEASLQPRFVVAGVEQERIEVEGKCPKPFYKKCKRPTPPRDIVLRLSWRDRDAAPAAAPATTHAHATVG